MENAKNRTIEFPNGVTPECPMGVLISEINAVLRSRGQALYWFRSSRSNNPGNVTINAGIFPIGCRTSVRGRECIAQLVHWEWCSRVGKTERSRQHRQLRDAWADYGAPEQVNAPEDLASISAAPGFEAEQAAIRSAGCVCDIVGDLPRDSGRIWGIRLSGFDETGRRVYSRIARRHNLAWERGARRHYIGSSEQLRAVYEDLVRHGFVVAVALDAAQAMNVSAGAD